MADITVNLGVERAAPPLQESGKMPEARERFGQQDLKEDAGQKIESLNRGIQDLLDLFSDVPLPEEQQSQIDQLDRQARENFQQAKQEIGSAADLFGEEEALSPEESHKIEHLKPFERGSEAVGTRIAETIKNEKSKAEQAGDKEKLAWLLQWEQSELTNGRTEIELTYGEIGENRQISGQANLNRVDRCKVGQEVAAYKPTSGENPDLSLNYGLEEHSMHKNEWLNYQISRVLGLDVVPPTVLRDAYAGEGSVQKWENIDGDSGDWMKADSAQAKRDIEAIGILHYATKQADGHKHNTLINREGRVKSFDNGVSFTPLSEQDHLQMMMESGRTKAEAYKALAELRAAGLVAPLKSRAYEIMSPSSENERKLSAEMQYKLDTFLENSALQDELQKQFQQVFGNDYGNRQFIDFFQRIIELNEQGFATYIFPS